MEIALKESSKMTFQTEEGPTIGEMVALLRDCSSMVVGKAGVSWKSTPK